MKRIISLMLSCAMILLVSASSAQTNAFDYRVFSSLAGYSVNEEDRSWRYEQYCQAEKGDAHLGLGFVAEQEKGKDLDAPWAWVEYTQNDAAKIIASIGLKVDGSLFHFFNLDMAPDGSYFTWNLGSVGRDMMAKLQHAQEIRASVAYDDQSAEFILSAQEAAGIIRWAQSILSSDLYTHLDEQLLLAYDIAYSPHAIIPSDQGSFDQTQLEAQEGFQLDKTGKIWRYERFIKTSSGSVDFGIGFVADGFVQGPLNYPWAWVEYRSARGSEPVSTIKILIDDMLYTFSALKLLDGYSCWTLGSKASTIAEKLVKTQAIAVKICFGDEIRDFRFDDEDLAPLRSWGNAVSGARIFSLLDQKLLHDLDEIYKVTSE